MKSKQAIRKTILLSPATMKRLKKAVVKSAFTNLNEYIRHLIEMELNRMETK